MIALASAILRLVLELVKLRHSIERLADEVKELNRDYSKWSVSWRTGTPRAE